MNQRAADYVIKDAHLLFAAPSFPVERKQSFPEIAVFGRSNVGKSTFVNSLVKQSRLARTSSTPGCTRELNFYFVRGAVEGETFQICLVDVPGFGYAKLAKTHRESLGRSIVDYVVERDQLQVVLILNDCRRDPQDDELSLRDTAANAGRHVFVCLTKCDKLSRNELVKAQEKIAAQYRLEASDVLVSGQKINMTPIWKRMLELVVDDVG